MISISGFVFAFVETKKKILTVLKPDKIYQGSWHTQMPCAEGHNVAYIGTLSSTSLSLGKIVTLITGILLILFGFQN